jgi:hypothetical protein
MKITSADALELSESTVRTKIDNTILPLFQQILSQLQPSSRVPTQRPAKNSSNFSRSRSATPTRALPTTGDDFSLFVDQVISRSEFFS